MKVSNISVYISIVLFICNCKLGTAESHLRKKTRFQGINVQTELYDTRLTVD